MAGRKVRSGLSPKLRFEVFKRDKFTCQYCGRSAPEVVLQADHIKPVSKEGDSEILNLITSCKDCNAGKGDRELSDDAVLQKRKAQLDELQERREQIEMMLEWQKGLVNLNARELESVCELWRQLVDGYSISESGQRKISQLLRRFGLQEVLESLRISVEKYIEANDEELPTKQSAGKAFDYIGRICSVRKAQEEKPYLRDLYYVCGILRNRLGCIDRSAALSLLERAIKVGADSDELKDMAKTTDRWRQWQDRMECLIFDLTSD